MPKKCCVPGCTSNYKGKEYTSVFAFPSDPVLKDKWLTSVPRTDYVVTNNSAVCIKHFLPELILAEDCITRADGTLLRVPRKKPKLQEDAVPTVFDLPSSLMSQIPKKRKQKLEDLDVHENDWVKDCFLKDNKITSFQILCEDIDKRVHDWIIIKSEHCITCCTIDTSGCPQVKLAVKIKPDFNVDIFCDGLEIDTSCFASVLSPSLKLDSWSKLETLLMILLVKQS